MPKVVLPFNEARFRKAIKYALIKSDYQLSHANVDSIVKQ